MIIPSRNRLLYNETLNYVYEILPITYIIEIVVHMIPPWAIVSNVYYFFVRNCRTHGHVGRFVSLWEISSSFIDRSCISLKNHLWPGPINPQNALDILIVVSCPPCKKIITRHVKVLMLNSNCIL